MKTYDGYGESFLLGAKLGCGLVSAFFLAAALLTGCVTARAAMPGALPVAGLERVYALDDIEAYRSPQPDGAQMQELVTRYGIKTVVKLNSSLEGHDTLPAGVEFIQSPLPDVTALLPPRAEELDELVGQLGQLMVDIDHAAKPVLIHCTHGEDRTGLVVGLYRVHRGTLASSAWGEMRAYGFHPAFKALVAAWVKMTGYDPEAK